MKRTNKRKLLNDRAVAAASPANEVGDTYVWDNKLRGFGLRIKPSGAKAFVVMRRVKGKVRRWNIGRDGMGAAQARAEAHKLIQSIDAGVDPDDALRAAERRQEGTLTNIVAKYLAGPGQKFRTLKETTRVFDIYVLPHWGGRLIYDIRRRDIADLLDKIEAGQFRSPKTGKPLEGGAPMAQHVLAEVRRMFNWYASRDDDFTSPIVRGMARTKPSEQARARVLTDEEIRAVWGALDGMVPAFGECLKFLLLTGQRRSEAAEMVRPEVGADGAWVIPASRYKTKRDHVVPLTPAARAILDRMPEHGEAGLIFTTNGKVAYSDWYKAKAELDAASGVTGWTIHDLRRTAHTVMTRFGVSHFDADRVLGHVIPGVGGTYNRYDYLAEKKRALETLATAIDRILNPQPNVVPLRSAPSA